MTRDLVPRQPLRVYRGWPQPHCQAEGCARTAAGHVVWLNRDHTRLNVNDVCAWHTWRLRPLGGALWYPWGRRPPVEQLLAAVNAELQRRRPPVFTYQFTYGTGTSTGNFRW